MTIVLAKSSTAKNFVDFHAYLDSLPLLFYGPARENDVTRSVPQEPQRVVSPNNVNELTLESGSLFAQGSFDGGMAQVSADRQASDQTKYLYSQGFDVSKGTLKHVKRMVAVGPTGTHGGAQVFDSKVWSVRAGGTNLVYATGELTSWTVESHGGTQTPSDLASSGAVLFAACGSDGVRQRVSASWSQYLNVPNAQRVAWLKQRLITLGTDSGIPKIYEGTTTTAFDSLPAGWGFNDVWEAGGFILAAAFTTGQSEIRAYGLNDAGTALELKTSTPFPTDEIIAYGVGFGNTCFLVGYKATGTVGVLYTAEVTSTGQLNYQKVYTTEEDGSSNLGVTCLAGTSVLFRVLGVTSDLPVHVGLGAYNLATGAITYGAASAQQAAPIAIYNNRKVSSLGVDANSVHYESATLYEATATYISSIGDGGAPGINKLWTRFKPRCKPLPSGTSFSAYYSTSSPEENDWALIGTYSTAGGKGTTFELDGVVGRSLAIKLVSNAASDGLTAPEIEGWDVLYYPTDESADDAEVELVRTVRLVPSDRKNKTRPPFTRNVRTDNEQIWDELRSQVVWYEPDATYDVRIDDIAKIRPSEPLYDATGGDATDESIVLQLRMRGTIQ